MNNSHNILEIVHLVSNYNYSDFSEYDLVIVSPLLCREKYIQGNIVVSELCREQDKTESYLEFVDRTNLFRKQLMTYAKTYKHILVISNPDFLYVLTEG